MSYKQEMVYWYLLKKKKVQNAQITNVQNW